MYRRTTQLALTFVSLCSALWVALAPVTPLLHQALASHRHVYCAVHHQFEDVSKRLRPETWSVTPNQLPSDSTADQGTSEFDNGVGCGFSQLGLLAFDSYIPTLGLSHKWLDGRVSSQQAGYYVALSEDILGYSPKRSPPAERAIVFG